MILHGTRSPFFFNKYEIIGNFINSFMFLCSSFQNENVRTSARFNPFELLPGVEE